MTGAFAWGNDALTLHFTCDADAAVSLSRISGGVEVELCGDIRVANILTVADGHSTSTARLVDTALGGRLRYRGHSVHNEAGMSALRLDLVDGDLEVAVHYELSEGLTAIRSWTTVRNAGEIGDVLLASVTSWCGSFGSSGADGVADWQLFSGTSEWLGEGRWVRTSVADLLPDVAPELTGLAPKGSHAQTSTGTWSTGENLPTAGVASEALSLAWLWQVETNGGWRWEIGSSIHDRYFALSGPTDRHHQWLKRLAPGDSFESVAATVVVAPSFDAAVGTLTEARRRARAPHGDNRSLPLIFNDYMNTLSGDPSTEKLLPLIDAAAEVGAEIFCIDAGWYDDGDNWWNSVGQWLPSSSRFSGGIEEVISRITSHGMVAGLWLEPEVVGVDSPVAGRLPHDAFLRRAGVRIVENGRYHLDLRSPSAIAHLDAVVQRLVAQYGIGYLKLDYNIDPGPGADAQRANGPFDNPGVNLLEHNRAHLLWLDSIRMRYPDLVLENCGSGAMRSDPAMLRRVQVQSTSDQQDYLKYPPIAASAALSMVPEQAGNWAYPQPEMSDEAIAFCLANGMLGRMYLSGHLDRMSSSQLALVIEATRAHKMMRPMLSASAPGWPLGLPDWRAVDVAYQLAAPSVLYLTVWSRTDDAREISLDLPAFVGADVEIQTIFPTSLPPWDWNWMSDTGQLHLGKPQGEPGARVLCLRAKR